MELFYNNIEPRMKKTKKISNCPKPALQTSKFKLSISEYSRQYRKYMIQEYPAAQILIRKIIQMPCCREYYLKFPLQNMLRGAVKKMMMNSYELGVYGYFLEQTESWAVNAEILFNLYDIFPDIIHVNEPTCPEQMKQLSMFLYFSSYSVKQFLNPSVELFKKEMDKIFPQFEHLHTHWINNQSTVNFMLNPIGLNRYLKSLDQVPGVVDYNTFVDKILQISPCYDLSASGRGNKNGGMFKGGKLPEFGYMNESNAIGMSGHFSLYNMGSQKNEDEAVKMEDGPNIDLSDIDQYNGPDL